MKIKYKTPTGMLSETEIPEPKNKLTNITEGVYIISQLKKRGIEFKKYWKK